jgi:hypothetical protein
VGSLWESDQKDIPTVVIHDVFDANARRHLLVSDVSPTNPPKGLPKHYSRSLRNVTAYAVAC